MKKNNLKPIGILGGMGPDASNYLYELLINKARDEYHAAENSDYPNILLHSIPVPDFITNKENASVALEMLKKSVKTISPHSSVMSIACNTVHIYLDDLQQVSASPFVSMISEVAQRASKYNKVGLLATPTTMKSNLYQSELKEKVEVILPEEEKIKQLGKIVLEIIGGNKNEEIRKELVSIADSLYKKGAEAIILGCTELPLVFPSEYKVESISSLDALASALLNKYYKIK